MNRLLISLLISVFTVVMILTAVAELNRRQNETGGRFIDGTDCLKSLDAPGGMELKKVKGSFKYKSEEEEDAKQMWIIAGEVPTTKTSFDTVETFKMVGQEPGTPYGLNHEFTKNPTGVKGRNGDRIKQKFIYYSANTRSKGHHSFPSFGFFKASIKDGKMKYMYSIKKANEGGMLIGMDDYTALHDGMKNEKPQKESNIPFECALGVDEEMHGTAGTLAVKATKSKGKGSIE
jgi:hypothetical protein